MNWKLVLLLSLFGVAMGVASLFGMTGRAEPLLWLLVFLFYAWVIATQAPGKYFLHGFLVSVLNGIWISIIHSAFFATYVQNNPQMQANLAALPKGIDPRVLSLVFGPLIGAITGIVAGLLAWIAAKVLNKRTSVSRT